MIVKVKQRNTLKFFYLDFYDGESLIASCSQSSITYIGNICINNLTLVWNSGKELISKIPFKKHFGGRRKNYRNILENEKQVGYMYKYSDASSLYYVISFKNQIYKVYKKISGKIFFSIYMNNTQIASLVKDNLITDALDTYTIFLIDEYQSFLELIMIFTGYVDNYEYGRKRAAFYGISYNNVNASYKTDTFFDLNWYKQFGNIEDVLKSISWDEAKHKIENYKKEN